MIDDEYYQHRTEFLAGGELLNLRWHESEEQRSDDWLNQPLQHPAAVVYVHARPFILRENLGLVIRMREQPDPDGLIGTAEGVESGEYLPQDIGNAQAWLYVEERVALLWEAYLFGDFRSDDRQLALWRAFESTLEGRADVREFFTPGWDPQFPEGAYRAMLGTVGYAPVEGTRFWSKPAGG